MYSPRRPRLLILPTLTRVGARYILSWRDMIYSDLPVVDCRPGLRSVCVVYSKYWSADGYMSLDWNDFAPLYIYVLWVVANPNKRYPSPWSDPSSLSLIEYIVGGSWWLIASLIQLSHSSGWAGVTQLSPSTSFVRSSRLVCNWWLGPDPTLVSGFDLSASERSHKKIAEKNFIEPAPPIKGGSQMSLTFTFELLHIENRRSNNQKIVPKRRSRWCVHWERKGAIDPDREERKKKMAERSDKNEKSKSERKWKKKVPRI